MTPFIERGHRGYEVAHSSKAAIGQSWTVTPRPVFCPLPHVTVTSSTHSTGRPLRGPASPGDLIWGCASESSNPWRALQVKLAP